MPWRIYSKLAEVSVPLVLAAVVYISWQADRRDRTQLASQLAAAQQTIAEAAARQKDRDATLSQTLSQIADLKQSVVTPAQLLKAFPQALALPQPITLESADGQGNVGARFSASPSEARTTNVDVGARLIVPPDETSLTNPPPATQTLKGNSRLKRAAADSPGPSSSSTIDNPLPKTSSLAAAPDAVIPSADLKPLYDFALDCNACQAKLTAAQNDLADEKTKSAALTQQRDAAVRAAKGGSALRRIARAAKWFALGAAAGAIAAKAH